jgi:hypothetical protein
MTSQQHGKWFWRAGYYVFPLTARSIPEKAERELQEAKEALDALERANENADHGNTHVHSNLSKEEALAETNLLTKKLGALIAFQNAFYRAQPRWELVDISARSPLEATAIAEEFLLVAKEASAEYCWILNEPPAHADWELHGWKHVSYEDLLEVSDEAKCSWVPEIRIDATVGSRNAEDLFKRAIAREPEAVATINFLLPSKEDRLSVAKSMCSGDVSEADVCRIPSPLDLGVQLLRVIMNKPTSPDAEVARKRLQQLISKKSLTRGSRGKGRPRENHHPETVRRVYIMANSLLRQVRQVDELLQRQIQSPIQRQKIVAQHYPWFSESRVYSKDAKSNDLLSMQPSEAALHVAAAPLGLSPSKVEKLVHRKRPS